MRGLAVNFRSRGGAAGRAQRDVRAGAGRAVRAAAGRAAGRAGGRGRGAAAVRPRAAGGGAARGAARDGDEGLGRARAAARARGRRRRAVAARGGAAASRTGCGARSTRGGAPASWSCSCGPTSSLRLLEEALEEQGLPTYVVGGRGYWSQEQVRDGLAWLRVLANPHDEDALLTVLASPFCGAGSDDLYALAEAGRAGGRGLWGAVRAAADERIAGGRATCSARERERAERVPVEVLLEHAIVATGYDLAVLARPGGDRRLANLRKLMRLAREFERAEGRDLRAFLADAAERGPRRGARGRGGARVRGARRRAADDDPPGEGARVPGRLRGRPRAQGGRRPAARCSSAATGPPACAWPRSAAGRPCRRRLGAAGRRGGAGGRRGGAAAVLRRPDARARAADPVRRDRRARAGPQPRPGGPPIDWIARAVAGGPVAGGELERDWEGRVARVRCATQHARDAAARRRSQPRAPARAAASTALPAVPAAVPARPARAKPAPQRLSYTQLSDYARCGYRFYLERVLRLPKVAPPPLLDGESSRRGDLAAAARLDRAPGARGPGLRPPAPPGEEAVEAARGGARRRADRRRGRGGPGLRRRVRGLAAVRAPGRGAHRPARGRVRVRARARRRRPAGHRLRRRAGRRRTTAARSSSTTRPTASPETDTPEPTSQRDYATQRLVYALAALRDGAPQRRGRPLPPRAPARARRPPRSPPTRRPTWRPASPRSPGAC